MLPEHGDSARQPEPFPVTIIKTPSGPFYEPGQQIQVQLRGDPGFQYTGFLIQARAEGSTVPVGSWAAGPLGTVVGCADPQQDFSGNDTAAHQAGSIRNIQDLVFELPQNPGRYRFELTTVERFGVYWMYQFSPFFYIL